MVELESAGEMTRSEVAAFLREFASELDDRQREEADDDTARVTGDREGVTTERQTEGTSDDTPTQEGVPIESARERKRITLIVGGDSATVTVPLTMSFDVEVESLSPMFGGSDTKLFAIKTDVR